MKFIKLFKLLLTFVKQKKYYKILYPFMTKGLPQNVLGDYIFNTIDFVVWNKKLPFGYRTKTLNSFIWHHKNDDTEIELKSLVTSKEDCKIFLKKIGLEKYVVPTIAIFDSIENARIFLIKSDLICKPTHLSGQYFFI